MKAYPNESYQEHPQEHNKKEPRDYQTDSLASNTRSKTKGEGQPSRCHKGDRVFFFSKKGDRIEGVVQWAGFSTISRDFGFRVIGIQTVSDRKGEAQNKQTIILSSTTQYV